MEDRAPLDKMVKVCIFSSSPPSPSVEDLRGRPMKVCFNFVNMVISFVEKFNKCYYTALKNIVKRRRWILEYFLQMRREVSFFAIIEDRKRG